MTKPLIVLRGLKVRRPGFRLDLDSFRVDEGEFVAILGKSGCGKSTLLTFLGLLASPRRDGVDEASDDWTGIDCEELSLPGYRSGVTIWGDGREASVDLERARREYLGFSLQGGELIPSLSLLDNVRLPMDLVGDPAVTTRVEAARVLERLGLTEEQRGAISSELSGGQKQRGVFARAIAHAPRVVLLDEPTSALDELTARSALDLLRVHARQAGQAVVMVTHDRDLAEQYATRVVEMRARCPDFDAMVRQAAKAARLPTRIVRAGPDVLEEVDYVGLLPGTEAAGREVADGVTAAVRAIAAAGGVRADDLKGLDASARQIVRSRGSARRGWGVAGCIHREWSPPSSMETKASNRAQATPRSRPPVPSAFATVAFYTRLGFRDAVGPVVGRLLGRLASARRGRAPRRGLQLGFIRQLIGNAAVVTAISVLLVVLMGMKQGLVSQFRENLLKSPTARELTLTPYKQGAFTAEQLEALRSELPSVELVIPVVSGLLGDVILGDESAEGITFLGTLPGDPKLSSVHADLDFSGWAPDHVVVARELAEQFGVDCGDTLTVRSFRLEDPDGTEVAQADATVSVLHVIDGDAKTLFIHADLADAMLDFKEGRAVPWLGWPAFRRAVRPRYPEYLIVSRAPLLGKEELALRGRSLTVEPLPADHSAHVLANALDPASGPPLVWSLAFTDWEGERVWQSTSPSDVEGLLTESDAIVLPWCEPLPAELTVAATEEAEAASSSVTVVGFSARSRWLKGHLRERGLLSSPTGEERTLRIERAMDRGVDATLRRDSARGRLDVGLNAFLPAPASPTGDDVVTVAADTSRVAFVPAELLSHLHLVERGEADYDPEAAMFLPAYRGRTYYKARAFVDDVFAVPAAHRMLAERFLVTSNHAQVKEMGRYVGHLDLLVDVLSWVALVIAVLATTQVFSDIVLRKQAMIGTLRIMGMRFAGISSLLVIRALLVGLVSLAACAMVSVVGALAINSWKGEALCRLDVAMFLKVGAGALVCCLLGTIAPLLRISRADPLESLSRAAEQR